MYTLQSLALSSFYAGKEALELFVIAHELKKSLQQIVVTLGIGMACRPGGDLTENAHVRRSL